MAAPTISGVTSLTAFVAATGTPISTSTDSASGTPTGYSSTSLPSTIAPRGKAYDFATDPNIGNQNLTGRLLHLQTTLAFTTLNRYATKASAGLAFRFYSGVGNWREYLIAGSDSVIDDTALDSTGANLIGVTIDLNDAALADTTAGTFTPSAVSAFDWKINAQSLSCYLSNLFSVGLVTLVNGDTTTPGTFQSIATYLESTIGTTSPGLVTRAGNFYYFRAPIQIGNGTTSTYFRQSLSLIRFEENHAKTANLRLSATNASYNGLVITTSASDDIRFEETTFTSLGKWRLTITGSGVSRFVGCILLNIGTSSLGVASRSTDTKFTTSDRINSSGATFTRCTFSKTTAPTTGSNAGALHLTTSTTITSCIFEENSVAVYINQAGTYSLIGHTFTANTTDILVDGVAVTLQLASGQTVTTSTVNGGSVTLQQPQLTTRLFGIPNVAGAIVMVKDLTTNNVTYPTVASGETTIVVISGRSYQVRADAPGYLASRFITFSAANTRELEFSLDNFRSLYDAGTNRSSQIIFNPATYEITITDDTLELSFADVFRTLEDYLATAQGMVYTAHPYPVVLPDRNLLWFPYDTIANTVNPAKIKPDPTNTADPALQFEVYLEDADDPTFDLFDFTGANGRIIRVRSLVSIANVSVSGGLSAEDRTVIDNIASRTLRVDGLIENVSGDRFKSKALETAPTGSGGSGATPQQIWEYSTRSLSDKTGFELSTANITAIVSAVWSAATRTLTSAVSSFSVADIWSFTTRSLTDKSGFAPDASTVASAVNTALQDDFANVSVDLTPVTTAIDALPVLAEIQAVLPDAPDNLSIAAIKAKTDAIVVTNGKVEANIEGQTSVDLTPVLQAIDGLNDLSSVDVSNAVGEALQSNPDLQQAADQATIAARNTQN